MKSFAKRLRTVEKSPSAMVVQRCCSRFTISTGAGVGLEVCARDGVARANKRGRRRRMQLWERLTLLPGRCLVGGRRFGAEFADGGVHDGLEELAVTLSCLGFGGLTGPFSSC